MPESEVATQAFCYSEKLLVLGTNMDQYMSLQATIGLNRTKSGQVACARGV